MGAGQWGSLEYAAGVSWHAFRSIWQTSVDLSLLAGKRQWKRWFAFVAQGETDHRIALLRSAMPYLYSECFPYSLVEARMVAGS